MNSNKKNKIIQLLICFVIALVIYGVIVLVKNYKDYTSVELNTNNNSIFTVTDLTVRNAVYGDLEDVAVTEFGNPKKIEKFKDNKQNYKTYYYDGLELTFKENNDVYILMKVVVTSEDYLVSRNIKVGNQINEVMNKFLVEKKTGTYLYGNYKENALNSKKVNENIFYGKRDKNIVYYLYMDVPYKKGYATWNDDIAQLTFKVKSGKVKQIEWMYGPVVD